MKTVPYNPSWLDSGLDLYAVYRRPRTQAITKARLTDEQGRQLWDYVTLPLKRHNDWMKKGYQYVTLARVQDLVMAKIAPSAELLAQYLPAGDLEERTFKVQAYLTHADVAEDAEFQQLKAMVYALGSEVVEQVSRHSNPHFVLPEALRGIAAGTTPPVVAAPAASAPPSAAKPSAAKPSAKAAPEKKEPVQA